DLKALAAGDLIVNGEPLSLIPAAVTNLNDALKLWNDDLDGKGANITSLVQYTASGAGSGVLRSPTETLTLAYTDGDGLPQSYVITGTNDMKELVAKINAETGIEATLTDGGKLVLTAVGGT